MKRITIDQATDAQLLQYATVVKVLNVGHNPSREKLIAAIKNVQEDDFIIVDDDVPQAPAPRSRKVSEGRPPITDKKAFDAYMNGKEYILISTEDKPGGAEPVQVSLNGRMMLIPRGEKVAVPRKYIEVLKEAQRVIWNTDDNGKITTPRRVPQYAFSIFGADA